MKNYLDLLQDIKDNGVKKIDRTGTGTLSVFGRQLRFDLSDGFPLLTTKKVFLRGIIHELIWFLSGSTNISYLVNNDVHIWDEWPFKAYLLANHLPIPPVGSNEWSAALAEFIDNISADESFAQRWGELGPVYGYQWRHWRRPDGTEIDQIAQAVKLLHESPDSRRIIVSAWNVSDIEEMAIAGLPPCHTLFQLYVADGRLSCQLYQRSADYFLGVPFNIASYALLTMMFAKVTGYEPGEFVHTIGDAHLYLNHIDQATKQLSRSPRPLPKMRINSDATDMFSFSYSDFELSDYDPYPGIKAPISV